MHVAQGPLDGQIRRWPRLACLAPYNGLRVLNEAINPRSGSASHLRQVVDEGPRHPEKCPKAASGRRVTAVVTRYATLVRTE
jgi:hypothetical protein